MCPNCNGKGYKDWIDRAKGKSSNDVLHYITDTNDIFTTEVKKGQEDEFKEKISLRIEGKFKFVDKDEL